MRCLARFWLPLLVVALASSSLSTLVYGHEEEAAPATADATEQVMAEDVVEDVVVDETKAATVEAEAEAEMEAKGLVEEEEEAAVKSAEAEILVENEDASQPLETEMTATEKDDRQSGLTSLKEKVSAVVDIVKDKSNVVVNKIKNLPPSVVEDLEKAAQTALQSEKGKELIDEFIESRNISPSDIVAAVLGVWGVKVGVGWIARNVNKVNNATE